MKPESRQAVAHFLIAAGRELNAFLEGLEADGYEAGRSEGYEEGLKEGMATQSQAQAASGSETAVPQQTVWVSRYFGMRYHSTPDCSRVIDPVQISLEEAEQEGYSRCSRCYEDA